MLLEQSLSLSLSLCVQAQIISAIEDGQLRSTDRRMREHIIPLREPGLFDPSGCSVLILFFGGGGVGPVRFIFACVMRIHTFGMTLIQE